ncbi:MAG: DUF6268 family outer membrane beta-barrel protein [Elusimicrobia bacterium]|nr:DUF6268 family outer membrane beta-barrel protein [Elusimicrobiota bacterium]
MKFFLLLIICLSSARAEEFRPKIVETSLDYRFTGSSGLLRPRDGVANDANVGVRPYNVRARLSRPWKAGAGTLSASFGYELLGFEYSNWQNDERVERLHSLRFMLGYHRRLNEAWALRVFGGPSLNSDLKLITAKALRATAIVGFDYTLPKDHRDKLGLGLAFVQVFGKNLVLPAVSYGRRRDDYRVGVLAPARLAGYWLPRKDLDLGGALAFAGGNFRIEQSGSLHGKRVEYSVGTVGPSLIYRPRPGWAWTLDGGLVLRHHYAYMDGNTLFRDLDMKRTGFVAIGAKVGF